MANLSNQIEPMTRRMSVMASSKKVDKKAVKAYLEAAVSLSRRVEASKTVTGLFGMGSGLTGIIEDVLSIATPLVAISGDFELSNLLGSLKVWLDKKKMQEAEEQRQRDAMMSGGFEDYSFNYSF